MDDEEKFNSDRFKCDRFGPMFPVTGDLQRCQPQILLCLFTSVIFHCIGRAA